MADDAGAAGRDGEGLRAPAAAAPATICGAFAALLDYPGARLGPALEHLLDTAGDRAAEALRSFASFTRQADQGEWEELYTRTFDLQPESCLYIGHHLFGEDWRRGMFMARLQHRYTERGFSAAAESPDCLPVVLRFLAAEPSGAETAELLHDCLLPAAARVLRVLEQKANPYAAVFRALLLLVAPEANRNFEAEDLACRPFSSSLFPILP